MKTKSEKIAELQEKFGRKDLSLGCEILGGDFDATVLHKTVGGAFVYRILNDCEDTIRESVFLKEKDFVQILGHPLTLSDVLRAMDQKSSPIKLDELSVGLKMTSGNESIHWNLFHNLLRDQSSCMVNFIYRLLK